MTTDEHIDVLREISILERSADRVALERAAVALVASGDATALTRLGALLGQGPFLARLDDLDTRSLKTRHLGQVLAALAKHPSPTAANMCLALAMNDTYLADPDRKTFLLRVLAAVRPMSEEAAEVFRDANAEGHFSLDAILLASNGSPRALALLQSMLADRSIPIARRIDAIRFTVYTHRTEPPMLELVGHLLARGSAHAETHPFESSASDGDMRASMARERELEIALVESVFDDRPEAWFDPSSFPPPPPAWESASTEALSHALVVATSVEARRDLPDRLRIAVRRTAKRIRAEFDRRERA